MKYKYIYIITLALSSLFTYKHLHANTSDYLHAFFMPNGALMKNTRVKDLNFPQKETPTKVQSVDFKSTNIVLPTTSTVSKKTTTTKQIIETETENNTTPKNTTYQLEDTPQNTPKQTTSTTKQDILKPSLSELEQKSTKELLSTLPFPDFKNAKFKQLYGLYGLELRTLYKERKLPTNLRQDDVLSKANSIRRFSVK